MEKFCESLREHAMKIINIKRKKNEVITNEQQNSDQNSKICYIYKEKFEDKHATDKNIFNIRDHCHYTEKYRGAAHNMCNLRYSVPKKIYMAFHNGSNYDYHFIIKELEKRN